MGLNQEMSESAAMSDAIDAELMRAMGNRVEE